MSNDGKKNSWNLEMALNVLGSQTVDAKLWSGAVEWLLLYGPPDIQEMILQSSGMATKKCFPTLKAQGFTDDGQPCYTTKDLAEALDVPEEEVLEKIADLEDQHDVQHLFDDAETKKIQ